MLYINTIDSRSSTENSGPKAHYFPIISEVDLWAEVDLEVELEAALLVIRIESLIWIL